MRPVFTALLLLSIMGCSTPMKLKRHPIKNMPPVGVTADGRIIPLGGFSGLFFEGRDDATGRLRFLTHTDRGPNGKQVKGPSGVPERRLALPDFQPRLVKLELDEETGDVALLGQIPLTAKGGVPLRGLTNRAVPGVQKERLLDHRGKTLPTSPFGVDLEGITRTASGDLWMAEENLPSLCRFSEQGVLLQRLSPGKGLPRHYGGRRVNRGFEAIAAVGDRVFAFLQSPLLTDEARGLRRLPVLEIDGRTGRVEGEHWYELGPAPADRVGDAAAAPDGSILVLEHDGKTEGPRGVAIYRVRPGRGAGGGTTLTKEPVLDLSAKGLDIPAKLEGMAVVGDRTLAIINDNDFDFDDPPAAGEPTAWIMFTDF